MKTKTQEIFELSCPYSNSAQGMFTRVLFVCSAGMLRSATAATIANELGMNARACGSAPYALIPISANLIHWAEAIYFVNRENYLETKIKFAGQQECLELIEDKYSVWNIEDCFEYNDPPLRAQITYLLS